MSTFDLYKKFETDDFQRRGDRYPASGRPDVIEVYDGQDKVSMYLCFKNTPIPIAVKWTVDFARRNKLPFTSCEGWQEGEYKDDWVMVELFKGENDE